MNFRNIRARVMQRLTKAPGYALLTLWTVFTVLLIG